MKITNINGTVMLYNGVQMPYFGLGVFEASEGNETISSIHWALEAGYKHIDTASMYMNEKSVGEAVRSSGIPREQLFITTKVWNSDQGFLKTQDAFCASLEKLKMDYIDLYLVHWPVMNKYLETWEALEELYQKKLVKSIGVSNFLEHHLHDLVNRKGMIPMVNQVEFHPYLTQPGLLKYCKEQHIQVEAWSPILKGKVNEIPEIIKIAQKYGKTPIQVVLRWDLQKGVVTIPKSAQKERIISNAQLFDFELNNKDVLIIDSLDKHYRSGPDPDNFDF